jgi:glycosyltransferase involved in cell wall biosynthesis
MLLENNSFRFDIRPRNEARTLLEAGYQVSVICPIYPGGKLYEEFDGVHVYQFPLGSDARGLLGYAWEYGYATAVMFVLSLVVLVQRGFDVLHAHNPPDTFFLLGAFYKLLGKRFVYDHHDLAPEMYRYARFGGQSNSLIYHTLALFEKLSCRVADCVLATNHSYQAIEQQRGGVPPERSFVVRNGPPLRVLPPVEPDPEVRQRAGTLLGYVGRIGPQDGVDYLIRAMGHLVHDLGRTDVLCMIIGDGETVPDLQALARKLHVEPYIWFVGWVADKQRVRSLLTTADICVDPDPSNPYNDRCTMIKMMEYMEMGKPIVAFDLPEHRFSAQDAALYACNNDEREFARHIATLMDDAALRARMGQRGRARLETELAWDHQGEQLLRAYEQIGAPPRASRRP